MKNLNFIIAVALAITLGFTSCKKEDSNLNNSKTQENSKVHNEGLLVLGKQLEDPYALKNMKKAYYSLKSANTETPDFDILPTHTYLRFLPGNEADWASLKSDTALVLYDYPLNYEIANLGTYYHDPTLPDSAITYQYCVVPIGFHLPNIQHELLYDVYIPDVNDSSSFKRSSEINKFLIDLEHESVRLTGNLPQTEGSSKTQGWLPSKWTPKGTITYYDNSLGINQPVVQASVHARWFTNIATALTNGTGYFQTSQFRYEVNYAIKWQRQDFEIREGRIGQAWYNGPKQKDDWNLNISGGMSRMYAIIHRAAYDYYYNNPFGIQSPPLNKWYNNVLSIGAFDWEQVDVNGDTAPWRRWYGTAEIRIFRPSRAANEIYSTTIHELAHASHWDLAGRFKFYKADDIVLESWARGVQREFTKRIYSGYSISYSRRDYTGVVEDMIDGNKTTISYSHSQYTVDSKKTYSDQISGYTLKQIEEALKGAKTFNQWRDNLKNLYDNGTENNLDATFTYWAD